MNEENILEITKEITTILLKKNIDYGGASFDLGLNGNMVHIYDKACRYKSLIEKMHDGVEPNFESIEDTIKDIIGYGIIGLLIYKEDQKKIVL